jgi:hypothetical protein
MRNTNPFVADQRHMNSSINTAAREFEAMVNQRYRLVPRPGCNGMPGISYVTSDRTGLDIIPIWGDIQTAPGTHEEMGAGRRGFFKALWGSGPCLWAHADGTHLCNSVGRAGTPLHAANGKTARFRWCGGVQRSGPPYLCPPRRVVVVSRCARPHHTRIHQDSAKDACACAAEARLVASRGLFHIPSG